MLFDSKVLIRFDFMMSTVYNRLTDKDINSTMQIIYNP